MAEMMTSEKKHGRTSQLKNIDVDMTPMVDLGFLLITFFMLAATLSKPSIIDLGLPGKSTGPGTEIDYRNQITLILGEKDQIYYYQKDYKDLSASDLKATTYEGVQVANLISNYKKAAPKPGIFTVIVKPTEESSYKNFVDVMDEIAISQNERYGLAEMKPLEETLYRELTTK